MSSETTTPVIPDESEAQASGGQGAWRFSRGKIVRGSETKGTLEAKDPQRIVGALRRVGIYEGTRDDGTPYSQVEADIETSSGLIYCKSSLTDDDGNLKPSIATCNFAWGLTQFKPGEVLMITTAEGQPTPKGGRPTYVNFWRQQSGTKFEQIFRPRRDKNAPSQDLAHQWEEMRPQIEQHPAFADRPSSRSDDEGGGAQTHLSALCKECAAKGWPTPEQAPTDWLKLLAAYFEHAERAKISDYSDDEWGTLRLDLQEMQSLPKILQPAADRLAGAHSNKGALL